MNDQNGSQFAQPSTAAPKKSAPMRKLSAIVLGASGSVGTALLRELLNDAAFDTVITISRRPLPEATAMVALAQSTRTGHPLRLMEQFVPDMTAATLEHATLAALAARPSFATVPNGEESGGNFVGFSVLGIGAGTAKLMLEEHRAVDVALNAAFARALRDSGKVQHLAFMSAAGANPQAKTSGSGAAGMARYNRVKGEAEEAVRANGPAVVSIFRPAMIIGSQHTPRLMAKVSPLFSFFAPAKFKPIRAEAIAQAMIAAAKNQSATNATHHYLEMQALIRAVVH